MTNNLLWWKGPQWLTKKEECPPNLVTSASSETMPEVKASCEIFAVALAATATDELDALLDKFCYYIRSCTLIAQFFFNVCTRKTSTKSAPLSAQELNLVKLLRERRECRTEPEKTSVINLQPNSDDVQEFRGRIQGHYPVYLLNNQQYPKKLVEHAHLSTVHGRVGLTMANLRERRCLLRLRKLAKGITRTCHGCQRF